MNAALRKLEAIQGLELEKGKEVGELYLVLRKLNPRWDTEEFDFARGAGLASHLSTRQLVYVNHLAEVATISSAIVKPRSLVVRNQANSSVKNLWSTATAWSRIWHIRDSVIPKIAAIFESSILS